jgi:23S rRNA-/tRNA-specific pseudouridylate synthase
MDQNHGLLWRRGIMGGIAVLKAAPGWLAIHKPAGLSVHNDTRRDLRARVRRQIEADPFLARTVELDRSWGVHAVHRLDRDTSGVLLIATQPTAFTALSGLFKDRGVRKRYLAVVHGRIETAGADASRGEWTWPLSVKAAGRNSPAGNGRRRPSQTCYRVLALAERYTLLSCEPVSGRQHQIRRHAKLAGHPVVGDRRYGSKRALTYLRNHFSGVRLALHARQLTFVPPGQAVQHPITLTADPVPDFMASLMAEFGFQVLKSIYG